VEITNNKKIIM